MSPLLPVQSSIVPRPIRPYFRPASAVRDILLAVGGPPLSNRVSRGRLARGELRFEPQPFFIPGTDGPHSYESGASHDSCARVANELADGVLGVSSNTLALSTG